MARTNAKSANPNQGQMTVQEAGERGGQRTSETHGREFYEEIGHKGGQRVRQLIEEGKEAEGGPQQNRSTDNH
jgi:general stress protein YciG